MDITDTGGQNKSSYGGTAMGNIVPSPSPGPSPVPPKSKPDPTPWTFGISPDAIERKYKKSDPPPPPPSKPTVVNSLSFETNKTDDQIAQMLLSNIGGKDLITIVRHNQINGIQQDYTPIKNLADVSLEYNTLAISANPNNVTDLLSTFPLDISKYIPTQAELDELYPSEDGLPPSDEIKAKRKVAYFDKALNTLFIHVKNIYINENIEVEFFVPDEVKDGTIYT